MILMDKVPSGWQFDQSGWIEHEGLVPPAWADDYRGVRLRDIDHDGCCEIIHSTAPMLERETNELFGWSSNRRKWQQLPFKLPDGARLQETANQDEAPGFLRCREWNAVRRC